MDQTLKDYISRVTEEMKKPVPPCDKSLENHYPVLPENKENYDIPNNPYSEV